MVLVLLALSDNALYSYHVLPKYFIAFQSYGPEQSKVVANVDGRTYSWTYGLMDKRTENRIPILCHA